MTGVMPHFSLNLRVLTMATHPARLLSDTHGCPFPADLPAFSVMCAQFLCVGPCSSSLDPQLLLSGLYPTVPAGWDFTHLPQDCKSSPATLAFPISPQGPNHSFKFYHIYCLSIFRWTRNCKGTGTPLGPPWHPLKAMPATRDGILGTAWHAVLQHLHGT